MLNAVVVPPEMRKIRPGLKIPGWKFPGYNNPAIPLFPPVSPSSSSCLSMLTTHLQAMVSINIRDTYIIHRSVFASVLPYLTPITGLIIPPVASSLIRSYNMRRPAVQQCFAMGDHASAQDNCSFRLACFLFGPMRVSLNTGPKEA